MKGISTNWLDVVWEAPWNITLDKRKVQQWLLTRKWLTNSKSRWAVIVGVSLLSVTSFWPWDNGKFSITDLTAKIIRDPSLITRQHPLLFSQFFCLFLQFQPVGDVAHVRSNPTHFQHPNVLRPPLKHHRPRWSSKKKQWEKSTYSKKIKEVFTAHRQQRDSFWSVTVHEWSEDWSRLTKRRRGMGLRRCQSTSNMALGGKKKRRWMDYNWRPLQTVI